MRTRADFLAIARQYAADRRLWTTPPRFDPAQRWYACLAETDGVQVWLLTWLPGQGTDLHDHGGSAGGFVVVEGGLTEATVSGAGLVEREYGAGEGHGFGEHHIHRMTNTSDRPAISVHAYGPALETMNRYEMSASGPRLVGTDRAGVTW